MKKIILTVLILTLMVTIMTTVKAINGTNFNTEITIQSDYCEGWEDGYCEGWKDIKGEYAICPITPLCPLPKLNCSEGYKCGYNRGFKAGMAAAED